jgi:hypothetical protein
MTLEQIKAKLVTPLVMDMSWINKPDYPKKLEALVDSTHQATVEEIIKIAEGMRVDVPTRQAHNLQSGFSKMTRRRSRWKAEAYNQALTDLIQAIKK